MTSQELVAQQNDLIAFVNEKRVVNEIEAALPENRNITTYKRALLTALLEKGEELVQANRASLMLAILRAAQLGLVPDGREGVINVYWNKKTETHQAQFLPMIYGIRRILAEYGWALRTSVIHEHDVFEYDEAEAQVTHHPPRPGVDRGKPEGAYALAVHRDGRRELVVYSAAQINEVREKSARAKNVWEQWPDRMWEKTPAHRLAKKLPLAEADRQRLERVFAENGNGEPEPEGDRLVAMVYGDEDAAAGTHPAAPHSTEKASPSIVEAGESNEPGSQPALSPVPLPEPDPYQPTADELEAAGQTRLPDPGEPVFHAGTKFAGKTIAEVHALGPEGRNYLEWAIRDWQREPMRTALARFAEDHPEMRPK